MLPVSVTLKFPLPEDVVVWVEAADWVLVVEALPVPEAFGTVSVVETKSPLMYPVPPTTLT